MKILSSIALAALVVGCGKQNSKSEYAKSESTTLDSSKPTHVQTLPAELDKKTPKAAELKTAELISLARSMDCAVQGASLKCEDSGNSKDKFCSILTKASALRTEFNEKLSSISQIVIRLPYEGAACTTDAPPQKDALTLLVVSKGSMAASSYHSAKAYGLLCETVSDIENCLGAKKLTAEYLSRHASLKQILTLASVSAEKRKQVEDLFEDLSK